MTTIAINTTGMYAQITVAADSKVVLDEQMVGSQVCVGLLVDERFYPLAYKKHTYGRTELTNAINQAFINVQVAIDALQPVVEVAPVAEQLIISDIIDQLVIAVEVARVKAANDTRWLNALETGYNWLIQQDSISYDLVSHELTVPSATTGGKSYHSNGACQCHAFETHNACWHRGASRLVRRALEIAHAAPVAIAKPKPVRSQAEKARINAEMAELWA